MLYYYAIVIILNKLLIDILSSLAISSWNARLAKRIVVVLYYLFVYKYGSIKANEQS